MQNSERQEAVYSAWQNDTCNMLIESVAGSGKTTTLMGLLERSQWRTLFLAFNKSIQTEIQEKIEQKGYSHAKAMTLHSLGYKTLRNYYKVYINDKKKWDIVNRFKEFHESDFKDLSGPKKMSLYYSLMDMLDVYRIYLCSSYEELLESMCKMGKAPVDHVEPESLKKYFTHFLDIYYAFTLKPEGSKIDIDFLDMIYLPVYIEHLLIPTRPYYLFIDECQDLNLVQHKFIDKLIAQGDVNKWVAVGDSKQAIYGFSGSYSKSFERFKNKENVQIFPLDVCYRCATSIVDKANQVYNVMRPFKSESGVVSSIGEDYNKIKNNSLVICRNTAPLINLYFLLLSSGRSVYIKGSDILAPTIKFLNGYSNTTIKVMMNNIQEILSGNESKSTDLQRIKFYTYSLHLENITALLVHLKVEKNKVSNLIYQLQELSKKSRESNAIELSTIHKSKGRESDVVYILDSFLIPSVFAITEEELTQEQNLLYVAITRAKKELYYLNTKKKK